MNVQNLQRCALAAAFVAGTVFSSSACARDTVRSYFIDAALKSEPVDNDIPLYFAGQRHPAMLRSFGVFNASRKTNSFGKSDEAACQHVFLSAVMALQQRARKKGGNAVINIRSNYHSSEMRSATQFECGAGGVIAGVALKGEIVKLEK